MRRGATTYLSILALLVAICCGLGNPTIPPVAADEFLLGGAVPPVRTNDGAPAPLGGNGGGAGGPGGVGGTLDSGDDDDYWDGVNNDQEPPRTHQVLPLLLQILENWWQTETWVLP